MVMWNIFGTENVVPHFLQIWQGQISKPVSPARTSPNTHTAKPVLWTLCTTILASPF